MNGVTREEIGLCQCGCGEKTPVSQWNNEKKGFVRGQPRRFIKGHNRRKAPLDYIEVDTGFLTPCWVWQRYISDKGYAYRTVEKISRRVHILNWEKEHGPVPQGKELDHLCRIRACVRPSHLEAVTGAVNTHRGSQAKLSMEAARFIRTSVESNTALGRRFGVSKTTVRQVRKGETWREEEAS